MTETRRKKDSAKLVWDTKPKRAPNPRDIEFQTAEIVIPNPKEDQGTLDLDLPLLATLRSGTTSLFPGQLGELPLAGYELDKSKMNRLIWGDNLLAMQALLAQGYAGKIDLIYIDPPFLSSADYSFQLIIEGKQVDKEPNIIERLAYIDTWEGGIDSYLDMMYSRLQLMKRLLSERGSFYLHCDWHTSHYLKVILDEIFGYENFKNEIVWQRTSSHNDSKNKWATVHDIIFFYSKSYDLEWNEVYLDYNESYIEEFYKYSDSRGIYRLDHIIRSQTMGARPNLCYEYKGYKPEWGWRVNPDKLSQLDQENRIEWSSTGRPYLKRYLSEQKGVLIKSIITDIPPVGPQAKERVDYPTQKPEALLERIITASSQKGDLVADFFCGSGTTMAVAEKLGRCWIGCNLDKVGIQVSRNRFVNQKSKPFLLENIGNYQRHMIYLSGSKIGEMQKIILKLYGAEPRDDYPDLGIREDELVYTGYPDRPVTAKKAIELAGDAQTIDGTGYKTLVILAWDYDYNFSTELERRKKDLGTKLKTEIKTLTIPPEIYNYLKKARNEEDLEGLKEKIIFHEKPYFKITTPIVRDANDGKVSIELSIDRYVLLDFPINNDQQKADLRKVIKDNFAALIDYWAIDWDYDGTTFKSQWQAIRGNGKRSKTVITTAVSPDLEKRSRSIAVRLVDVFGNDASATVEIK